MLEPFSLIYRESLSKAESHHDGNNGASVRQQLWMKMDTPG